jgi:hypothetical protein
MVSIDEGIQIDRTDEQYENADLPRIEILQSNANVTESRQAHWLKHPAETVSISSQIETSLASPQ